MLTISPVVFSAACSLQGEKPLSEKSVEQSSNAYDQHLLAKIGKPSSPPRRPMGGLSPSDFGPIPFHSKSRTNLPSLSIGEASLSPHDAVSRWNNMSQSAAISPGTRPGWSDYVTYRSPSMDSTAHSMDVDSFGQSRDKRTGTRSRKTSDDVGSLSSRSNRGSYDQGVFPDADMDLPMDDAGNIHRLHPEDRKSFYMGSVSPVSRQGMKRRASSPPREAVSEVLPRLHTSTSNGDLDQRRTTGFPFNDCTSPGARYPPSHGSVSSASSISLRTGSYASSTGLSVGGSSMTSMSSFDRLSPGGVSPTSEMESACDKGMVSPSAHKSFSGCTGSRGSQCRDSGDGKSSSTREVSMGNTLTVPKPNAPRGRSAFMCKCCHKKPKKFDNPEDLRCVVT